MLIADGSIEWVKLREPMMLDGIDGLIRHNDDLIAIQNGTNPRRILRLQFDEQDTGIVSAEILERSNPRWGEPTLGTLIDDRLIYVADGQWEVYGAAGKVREGQAARPTGLRALPLP